MKKVLLSVLAVGMLTACSQDETISMQSPTQIAFEGAFVNKATRAAVDPSITNEGDNALTTFSVWGYVENKAGNLGEVFDAVKVTKTDDVWKYSPLQYWAPQNNYYFFALATNKEKEYIKKDALDKGSLAQSGLGQLPFTNADGTEDLLYASATAVTGESIKNPAPVKFVFDHLLSKVKFTFKNGFATNYSTIKVTDIKMTVPSNGTINLNQQGEYNWDNIDFNKTISLDFGAIDKGNAIAENVKGESDKELLTIPTTADYTVTFNVELFQDGASVLPEALQLHTVKISGYELKPGLAYNFVATLTPDNVGGGLLPIEFEAEVEDWVEAGDQGFFGVKEVSTAEQLAAALAEGGSVKLMEDVTITSPLKITKDADLNLNNCKITAPSSDAIVVDNGAKFTVNGNGDVKAATDEASSANALWLIHGTAYINGGNWYVGADGTSRNDCMYVGAAANKDNAADYESHLIITGGTFEAKVLEQDQYWVLNIQDQHYAAGSTITVYGGSFKNFDPANNKSENPATSFVAEGYESVEDGDYFVVKAK